MINPELSHDELLDHIERSLDQLDPNASSEAYLSSGARRHVLDEGLLVVAGIIPVISGPLAVAGLTTAAAVKLYDGGPILYRSPRVGRDLEKFDMIKFRSMNVSAGIAQKKDAAPHITPPGRIIRKLSLDELPGLWNVAMGDMSFIGPRPIMPGHLTSSHFLDCFATEARAKEFLNDVYGRMRPGVSGPNQVNGSRDFGESTEKFAKYIMQTIHFYENASPKMDRQLLRATIKTVATGHQAY